MTRHPEYRDQKFEAYIISRKFGAAIEERLRASLNRHETIPTDPIACPVESCGNPVRVEAREGLLQLVCTNCGWRTLIKKNQDK